MTTASPSTHDPVDRLAEDFLIRYRRGELRSVSEYVQQFPDVADEVADVIQVLMMMENLGAEQVESQARFEGSIPEKLGDYRLIREIGRGGMGVVFEAIQEELGRHVALKVLPAAALLRPRQVARFRREARAAARLHHSNIVPVHGVGSQDGIHFYAMQYIQGQGLDAVLQEVRKQRAVRGSRETLQDVAAATQTSNISGHSSRSDYARSVARIGLQIAEALAHAHSQGILHRDIKPGNILLDQEGRAWLSDFGLAHLDASDQLTGTGELVGTLRYMAPERFKQAGDARSDLYSLGATLYELLALQPTFPELDRPKLVQQILQEEPTALRKLDSQVPRDLETIILKAISKEPELRYDSAQQLAEDLSRFLVDRPVTARRLNWCQRSWRWAGRNRALSAAVGLVLATLLTGLGMTYSQWQRAEWEAGEKESKRKEAAEQAAIAKTESERANRHAQRSQRLLDTLLNEIIDFPERVTTNEARQRLMTAALEVQSEFTNTDEMTPLENARLALRAGQLHARMQDRDKALASFEQVQELLGTQLKADPQSENVRFIRATCLLNKGDLLRRHNQRSAEAEEAVNLALGEFEALRTASPSNAAYTFSYCNAVTTLVEQFWQNDQRRLPEAIALLQKAVNLQDEAIKSLHTPSREEYYSASLGRRMSRLAILQRNAGRLQDAEATQLETLKRVKAMALRWPASLSIQSSLAACYINLSSHYISMGNEQRDTGKALQNDHWQLVSRHARSGLDICERLCRQVPADSEYRSDYGAGAHNYGVAFLRQGRTQDAEKWLKTAIELQREAIRLSPQNVNYQRHLRQHHYILGDVHLKNADHVKAGQIASQLVKLRDTRGTEGLFAARIWAGSVQLARKDLKLTDTERDKLIDDYAAQAIAALKTPTERALVIDKSVIDSYWYKELSGIHFHPEFQSLFSILRSNARARN